MQAWNVCKNLITRMHGTARGVAGINTHRILNHDPRFLEGFVGREGRWSFHFLSRERGTETLALATCLEVDEIGLKHRVLSSTLIKHDANDCIKTI